VYQFFSGGRTGPCVDVVCCVMLKVFYVSPIVAVEKLTEGLDGAR